MRRATLAGVETIEHGDGGTPEVFRLMKERGVALCPTLSIASGANVERKRNSFKAALAAARDDREWQRRRCLRSRR